MKTKDILLSKWYILGKSWGNGTAIVASNPDPHKGILICENDFACFNPENYENISIQDIMKHIVKIHNDWLPRFCKGGNDYEPKP